MCVQRRLLSRADRAHTCGTAAVIADGDVYGHVCRLVHGHVYRYMCTAAIIADGDVYGHV